MRITTSYFGNIKNVTNPIAICAKSPDWYKGPEYKKLAPTWEIFKKYKEDKNEHEYIEEFNKCVLAQLDGKEVLKELQELAGGDEFTLLCWEKNTGVEGKPFCHRYLVATWLYIQCELDNRIVELEN